MASVVLIQDWVPPSRENYDWIMSWWQFFPLFGCFMWFTSWYGMGKTSVNSCLNIPGRTAWFTMEIPGSFLILYIMKTLPEQNSISELPWQNKMLAGLFVLHYIYRGFIFPWIQPSISPIHTFIWLTAIFFNFVNATCLGAWFAAYGPTNAAAWDAQLWPFFALQTYAGILLFVIGLSGNFYHDEELRRVRRREAARQARIQKEQRQSAGRQQKGVAKFYAIPQAGLFKYMLFPHYFMEWIEWLGYYVAAGWSCAPALIFLLNEIAVMTPRAVRGKAWYMEWFGEEKIGRKWAIIPGIV